MAKLDHSKLTARDRVKQHGHEAIDGSSFSDPSTTSKPKKSKAEIKAETADAMVKITRIVRCSCGHQATIAVPSSWANQRFKCTKCGRRTK